MERLKDNWERHAQLMSLLANAHSNGRKKYEPDDFNPYRTIRRKYTTLDALEPVFRAMEKKGKRS